MNEAQLIELARQMLYYMSPLIAAGALTKVGEGAVDGAKVLAHRTWEMLQRVVQGNAEAEAALVLYERKPEDQTRQEILVGEIVTGLEQNSIAANELASLVDQARELQLIPQQVAQRIHNQTIKDDAVVGVAIAGDTHSSISVDMGSPTGATAEED
jgi:uncharacterized protein with PhoU and TrkA domain